MLAAAINLAGDSRLRCLSLILLVLVTLDLVVPWETLYGDHAALLAVAVNTVALGLICALGGLAALLTSIILISAIALNFLALIGVIYGYETLILLNEQSVVVLRCAELAVLILFSDFTYELCRRATKICRNTLRPRVPELERIESVEGDPWTLT